MESTEGRSPRASPTVKPFRFKRSRSPSQERNASPPAKKRTHRHHHHHRRRKRSSDQSAAGEPSTLDPETAFRESLFDALADDEGAAFWEGVYGQPIHTYSPYRHDPERGELERMTDEEYTAHVRAQMWHKSHGYILEERERRAKEREERKKEQAERDKYLHEAEQRRKMRDREREERHAWERTIDEGLTRKKRRTLEGEWRAVWMAYLQKWQDLTNAALSTSKSTSTAPPGENTTTSSSSKPSKQQNPSLALPFPVKSLHKSDLNPTEIEKFIKNAPLTTATPDVQSILKIERVRWHPDKIQHRFGGLKGEGGVLDEGVIRDVTSVFQVLDRLWGEVKAQS